MGGHHYWRKASAALMWALCALGVAKDAARADWSPSTTHFCVLHGPPGFGNNGFVSLIQPDSSSIDHVVCPPGAYTLYVRLDTSVNCAAQCSGSSAQSAALTRRLVFLLPGAVEGPAVSAAVSASGEIHSTSDNETQFSQEASGVLESDASYSEFGGTAGAYSKASWNAILPVVSASLRCVSGATAPPNELDLGASAYSDVVCTFQITCPPGEVIQVGVEPQPISGCFGDADANLVVNFADVTQVLALWGTNYRPGTGAGDADGDGLVNFADITSVLANFGSACE